jgi:excisionase family DNA binding protein
MQNVDAKLLLSIPEVVNSTGICRSNVYKMMESGEIESVKVGKRRLIPADSLHAWIEKLRGQTANA